MVRVRRRREASIVRTATEQDLARAVVFSSSVLAEGRLFRNHRREQKAVLSIAEAFKRPHGCVPIQQQEQRWKNLRLSETSRVSRSVSLLRRGMVLGSHAYVSLHSRRGATGSFP